MTISAPALVLLTALGTAPPAPTAQELAGKPEYLAHPNGYLPRDDNAGIDLAIPKVIAQVEWRMYCDMLSLSEPQRVALEEPYDRYRRADWAFRLKEAQPLWDRSAELALLGNTATNSGSAAALAGLFADRDKIVPGVEQIERLFLDEIAQVLSESQLAVLDTVKQQRERFRAQELGAPFPAFTFDVDEVLSQLQQAGKDITPHDLEQFAVHIQTWREGAGALYNKHYAQVKEAVSQGGVLRARAYEARIEAGGSTPDSVVLLEEFREMRRSMVDTERRIHELTSAHVELIAAELPRESGNELRARFLNEGYRPLFPDACDLQSFFEAVSTLPLSDQESSAADGIKADWHAVTTPILHEMFETYLDWWVKTWVRAGYPMGEYTEYSKEMLRLSNSRVEKSRQAVAATVAALSEEHRAAVRTHVEAAGTRFIQFESEQDQAIKRHSGWPSPYD